MRISFALMPTSIGSPSPIGSMVWWSWLLLVATFSTPLAVYSQMPPLEDSKAASLQQLIAEVQAADSNDSRTDTLLEKAASPVDTDTTRGEKRREYLAALRKPVSTIQIESIEDSAKSPASLATEADTARLILVSSLGREVRCPDRYPVAFCHEPLYFEQAKLERCGQHLGVFQNAVSFAQFFGRTELLPYHLAAEPIGSLVRSAGDCRRDQAFDADCCEPLDRRAALLQAAAIAGFIVLLQ